MFGQRGDDGRGGRSSPRPFGLLAVAVSVAVGLAVRPVSVVVCRASITARLRGRRRRGRRCSRRGSAGRIGARLLGVVVVRLLGVPLTSALRYASREPAMFLGVGDRVGALANGYQAAMIAFDPDDLRILGTWVAGNWAETP